MKKNSLTAIIVLAVSLSAFAQKGNNKIGIGGEIAFPAGKDMSEGLNSGFGGWVKFLFGVGKSDHVSFSSGYTSFKAKGSSSQESASLAILPFMLGFQHTIISGLYIEPQLGLGSYRAKYTVGGQSVSGSRDAFTYAIGAGYEINDIDFGLRFQSASIEGYHYSNVALRIGYNFSLKSKSSK